MSMSTLTTPQSMTQNRTEIPIVYNPLGIVSQNWSFMQPESSFNHETTMRNLEYYVKTELFHLLVFISNPAISAFSKEPMSLCQVVCNKLNVPLLRNAQFWQ